MSRTRRNIPYWAKKLSNDALYGGYWSKVATLCERGQVSIPKVDPEKRDEVWGQRGKKWLKRRLTRKQRMEGIDV